MQREQTNRPLNPQRTKSRRWVLQRLTPLWRAAIEIGFIVFLFYSNLLMGEFTASNSRGKTLALALIDIFTATNIAIALVSALIGYLVFEYLRKKL
jgi:succinate dehydrogenase hydrophobic anchor subunit